MVEKLYRYLGMPVVVGRSKVEVLERHRDFSMASREVLIQVVLQAIPTYVISCLLPSTLIQDIEKIVCKFGAKEVIILYEPCPSWTKFNIET